MREGEPANAERQQTGTGPNGTVKTPEEGQPPPVRNSLSVLPQKETKVQGWGPQVNKVLPDRA